ncbi:MAG: hypothetical protein JWR75_352 [Devosia sp.]|nr:hypothetical protein [Devosia sp.]
MADEVDWLAVDWGTSNLRAWGISAAGETVFSCDSENGMGKLSREQFPAALTSLIGDVLDLQRPTEVLICGMAGARQGWLEAPYLETPANLGQLAQGAVRPALEGTRLSVRILPGVCQKAGGEDVIRGEETQLLGLITLRPEFSGVVAMPGTHCKWAMLEAGKLTRFATAMTGELYELLSTHSVLRHSLTGERNGPATEEGTAAGLDAGLAHPEKLTNLLFRTRAAALVAAKGADWCSGYLSGLLIGAEIGGMRDWIGTASVPIVGSARLARTYGAALDRIGVASEAIDATEATLAGLKAAKRQLDLSA